jgi:hypothetical protein
MKTLNETWKELLDDKLSTQDMIKIRGGDGGEEENPVEPIVK